jgi:hypothetical protein
MVTAISRVTEPTRERVAQVHRELVRLSTDVMDPGMCLGRPSGIEVHHRDLVAFACPAHGGGPADARGGASHHGNRAHEYAVPGSEPSVAYPPSTSRQAPVV